MDYLIYVLVGIIALAVVLEAVKRSRNAKRGPRTQERDAGPYISADEADPTQTGRMRAMPIKRAIRGEEVRTGASAPLQAQGGKPRTAKKNIGAHRSIDHEKVESTESGAFDLPDPFTIDIAEDNKE